MTSPPSSQTIEGDGNRQPDLGDLPPVFVSLTHFPKEQAELLEERLSSHGASITYDLDELQIVFTKVERARRAQLDLRSLGIWTDAWKPKEGASLQGSDKVENTPQSENDAADTENEDDASQPERSSVNPVLLRLKSPTIKVMKVAWIEKCLSSGKFLPVEDSIVFEGMRAEKPDIQPESPSTPAKRKRESTEPSQSTSPNAILARARLDAQEASGRVDRDFGIRNGIRRFGDKARSSFIAPYAAGASSSKHAPLLTETTSEHDGAGESDAEMPPVPDWIEQNLHYSCQRRTPASSPNESFICELKEIRTARLLTGDEIGVRAYSTSIAAIASYPHRLRSSREVLRLPGCDVKIARLFAEHASAGKLVAAEAARNDKDLAVLRLFYDIWGVGAVTARDFYLQRGWRDLDDVVDFGWAGLSRVQQIGVKYYDEFLDPIPRAEVAAIAAVVHAHAVKVRDARVTSLLVGGYRRGKKTCGDVDLLVSHPDESATKGLVSDIVASLEEEGCITHTLLLALTSSNRDQQTLPFRASEARGSGFDTLDKALVVWQDPSWPSKTVDLANDPKAKNPAPHRRLDIIVSPWRTVGCAVAGWSGGTTFQRDLRRYAKSELGWKFDSSGVRERGSGLVVDVEGYYSAKDKEGADGGRGFVNAGQWTGRATSMEEAERRVFEAMGLEFIEPEDRCTG